MFLSLTCGKRRDHVQDTTVAVEGQDKPTRPDASLREKTKNLISVGVPKRMDSVGASSKSVVGPSCRFVHVWPALVGLNPHRNVEEGVAVRRFGMISRT